LAKPVSYRIADRPDGRCDVIAVLHPRKVFRREGLATLAEAEEWEDGLRVLMAACGAPIVEDVKGAASKARDSVEQPS
jgi:hypothetical protein